MKVGIDPVLPCSWGTVPLPDVRPVRSLKQKSRPSKVDTLTKPFIFPSAGNASTDDGYKAEKEMNNMESQRASVHRTSMKEIRVIANKRYQTAIRRHNRHGYNCAPPTRKALKEVVTEAYNNGMICPICGQEMVYETTGSNDRMMTLEHIMPLSRGGDQSRSNLIMICRECNCAKGSMTVDEYERMTR